MQTIAIIGAGMMGSAMSLPLSDNGHRVRIIGTHLDREIIEHARATGTHLTMKRALPKGAEYFHIEQLDEALRGVDAVIGGVSSFGVEWFAKEALPRVPVTVPVLSVTKGLQDYPDGTMLPFPHVLKKLCPMGHTLCAIGGPCTSYELADRRHSCVTFCGDDIAVLRRLKTLLETDYYHISLSTDVIGVECAVALKNAYALAVTLAVGMTEKEDGEGCTLAYNPQAGLFGQSVREIGGLLRLVGGGAENIMLAAGDLYVTVFGGRTRRLGTLLGRGLPFDEAMAALAGVTLESVSITRRMLAGVTALAARGLADTADYPLLMHIGRLLSGETGIGIPWQSFCIEKSGL